MSRHTAREAQGDSYRRNAFKAAMREEAVKPQRDAQHGHHVETAAKRQIEPSDATPPQQYHRQYEGEERSNDGNHRDPTFKLLVRMYLLYRASINDEANLVPSLIMQTATHGIISAYKLVQDPLSPTRPRYDLQRQTA